MASCPRISETPRSQRAVAVNRWDPESSIVVSTVSYPAGAARLDGVAERIARAAGIREEERRLVIGGADILLDSNERILSIELYSNPQNWTEESLAGAAAAEPVWLSFEVDYDPNGVATVEVPLAVARDRAHRRLVIRFGDPAPGVHYLRAADDLLVGLGAASELRELVLENLDRPLSGEA